MDETLYIRIDRLKKKIEQNLEEKILAKQKPRSSRGRPRKSSNVVVTREDDDSNDAIIVDNEEENSKQSDKQTLMITRSGRRLSPYIVS